MYFHASLTDSLLSVFTGLIAGSGAYNPCGSWLVGPPHRSDEAGTGDPYLNALSVAVCGTQWTSEQLAADQGWLRACSTRQAAVAYSPMTAAMAKTTAHFLDLTPMMLTSRYDTPCYKPSSLMAGRDPIPVDR